jgi:A-macroglobulin receptor binding domain
LSVYLNFSTNMQVFQRVETKDLETVLIVYYYSIGVKEVCLGAEAVKTSNVALLKPAPVRVYDYYDNSKFKTVLSNKMWISIDLFFQQNELGNFTMCQPLLVHQTDTNVISFSINDCFGVKMF